MQYSQYAIPADHGQVADGSSAFGYGETIVIQLAPVEVHRLPCSKHRCRRLVLSARYSLAHDSLAARKVESVEPQRAVLSIRQGHTHAVTLHHVANVRRNLPKKVA